MSSFDVVDDQLKRLSDRKLFPKLRRVVVAGFSAGGQFVSRYVAVGKCPAREDLKVEYVVLGPSTEFWMLPEERWLYGLASRPRYPAACDEKTMRKNLESRFVWRGVGDKDTGGSVLDLSPEAKRQGANRKARQHAFVAYLKEKYPAWAAQTCQKDIPNCGHSLKVWADEDLIEFILTGKRFTTPDQSK